MNHTSRQAHVRLAPSVLLLCGLLVAAGCTRVVTVTAPGDALHVSYGTQTETPAYWWDVGISIARAEDAQTLWHVDTLLADQLFRPIIKELGPRLKVWRFHRRARRDERVEDAQIAVESRRQQLPDDVADLGWWTVCCAPRDRVVDLGHGSCHDHIMASQLPEPLPITP